MSTSYLCLTFENIIFPKKLKIRQYEALVHMQVYWKVNIKLINKQEIKYVIKLVNKVPLQKADLNNNETGIMRNLAVFARL